MYSCNWQLRERDFDEQKKEFLSSILVCVRRFSSSSSSASTNSIPIDVCVCYISCTWNVAECMRTTWYVFVCVGVLCVYAVRELFHVKHILQQAPRAHVSQQPISVYVMCSLLLSPHALFTFTDTWWARFCYSSHSQFSSKSISTSRANTIEKPGCILRFPSWSCSLECHTNWKLTSIFEYVFVCVQVHILVNRSSMVWLRHSSHLPTRASCTMHMPTCFRARMHLGKSAL